MGRVGGPGLGRKPGAGGREELCVHGHWWPRGQGARGAAGPGDSRLAQILALEDLWLRGGVTRFL